MTKGKIRMEPSIRRRVNIQVSLFTAIVVTLLTFSIFWFQYRITYNDILISLRDQAEAVYGYVEKRLDKSTSDQVRTREDMEGDAYKQVHEALQRIREISDVQYLHTAKMNEDGKFVYLIGCLDQSEPGFRYPGDLIEHGIYPDMQRALDGQKVLPDQIKDTEWGKIFITYMPIYDREQVLGAVGIELKAGHQYDTYRSLRLLLPLFILLLSLGACLASRLLFRHVSNPFYQDMSNTGYLTQLKSRSTCQLGIGSHIAKRAQEGTGSILLDLNGLKYVDDTLGHDVGDVYITRVSETYPNMQTREAVIYRIGGDEFVVMMPDTDRDKVQDFTRRFGDMFNREASVPGFTFSRGYPVYDPKADTDFYSMCCRTDKSIYMREQQCYKNKDT